MTVLKGLLKDTRGVTVPETVVAAAVLLGAASLVVPASASSTVDTGNRFTGFITNLSGGGGGSDGTAFSDSGGGRGGGPGPAGAGGGGTGRGGGPGPGPASGGGGGAGGITTSRGAVSASELEQMMNRGYEGARSLPSATTGWTSDVGAGFASTLPIVTGPLWTAGPTTPQTYGTAGPNTVQVEIRHNTILSGSHAIAVIGQQGQPGYQTMSLEVGGNLGTYVDESKSYGTPVGTFHMTPEQARTFEAVYRAHGQNHTYRVGDSNLAMHTALIAAGFPGGVTQLVNPPGHPHGYVGYNNSPVPGRWF